jgi:hypothetical protein
MRREIFAAFIALMLTSCVQVGQSHYELSDTRPALEQGKARIYVFRESAFIHATLEAKVGLNGATIGQLANGAYVYFDTKPGTVKINVIDNWEVSPSTTMSVKAIAGQEHFVAVLPKQVAAVDGDYSYPTGKEEVADEGALGFKLLPVEPDYGRWQIVSMSPAGYLRNVNQYIAQQIEN